MSKTERALETGDDAALDELDEFVASEAEAADVAIGELIDPVVEDRHDEASSNGHDAADVVESNGFDTSDVEGPEVDDEVVEVDDHVAGNGFDTSEVEVPEVDDEVVEVDEIDEADSDAVIEAESDVATDEADVETYELPEIVPATVDDAEDADDESGDESGEVDAREGDADEEVSDEIIEELRRADIDGPLVEFAPQDDTTSARRRPKRRPDYDPAPVPIPAKPPRVLGRKPRVRKVTRVVRHVDPWSVFKIAAVANMVLYIVLLTAGVLLWNVAYATGTIDNVERFFESFGWSSFEFKGGEIYHAAWIAGLFVAIGLTGLAVLLATMFNLITDIVGGMRFTVLEEEVVETRTSPMRRFVVRRPEPEVPAHTEDASGSLIREAVVDDSGAIERRTR